MTVARSLARRLARLEAAQRTTAAATPHITIVAVNLMDADGETRQELMTPAGAPTLRPLDYRTVIACLAPPDEPPHAT